MCLPFPYIPCGVVLIQTWAVVALDQSNPNNLVGEFYLPEGGCKGHKVFLLLKNKICSQ